MIHLNIWLTVNDPGDLAEVREALAEAARLSCAEPGCLRFEAYESTRDPVRFLLHERWESQAALDVHRTGLAYTTVYQPRVLPKVTREAHPSALVE